MNGSILRFIAYVIVLIGALNWGLIGLLSINLLGLMLGGEMTLLARLIYFIIGLCGGYVIYFDYFKKSSPPPTLP